MGAEIAFRCGAGLGPGKELAFKGVNLLAAVLAKLRTSNLAVPAGAGVIVSMLITMWQHLQSVENGAHVVPYKLSAPKPTAIDHLDTPTPTPTSSKVCPTPSPPPCGIDECKGPIDGSDNHCKEARRPTPGT